MNNELKSFIGKIITPVGDKYDKYVTVASLRDSLLNMYAFHNRKAPACLTEGTKSHSLRLFADELEKLDYMVNRHTMSGQRIQPASMTVAGHILGPDMNKVLGVHFDRGSEEDYVLFSDLVAKMREILPPGMFEIVYNASNAKTTGSFPNQLSDQGIDRYRVEDPDEGTKMAVKGWCLKPDDAIKKTLKNIKDGGPKTPPKSKPATADDVMEQITILRGDVQALSDEIGEFRAEMSAFREKMDMITGLVPKKGRGK